MVTYAHLAPQLLHNAPKDLIATARSTRKVNARPLQYNKAVHVVPSAQQEQGSPSPVP